MYWSRIINLFLKVLCKMIYEVYWFCCLLFCRDRNKENFARRPFLSVTKLRRKRSVMQQAWHLRTRGLKSVLSPGSLAFFIFRNYQSWNLNNQWNDRWSSFALTIYNYYEWRDPNTEEKSCIKIQLPQMKFA